MELAAELGEPFARFWRRWATKQGAKEAARSLPRLQCSLDVYGERRVRGALAQHDAEDKLDPLSLE